MIAYFSMEIGIEPQMPTYSGGLGVLAADAIRSAAEMKVPMVAVTLLHRRGYFRQKLSPEGWQSEEAADWPVERYLCEMPGRATITIEGRTVTLRAWRYSVAGPADSSVPIYFLDTDLPENTPWDRTLTHYLYGGDSYYRLCQEVVLGIGGVRMLRALGYAGIERFHMNEGHSSLLTLELLDEEVAKSGGGAITAAEVASVRKRCVFTTHTPVIAGHDQFPLEMATGVLGRSEVAEMQEVFCCDGVLNMTYLALNLSHYVNGVAKRHGEISRHMFARYIIHSITNGVHAGTWTAPAFQRLFDRHIPGWRQDNFSLRYALGIPREELWQAHVETKQRLIEHVVATTGVALDPEALTIGFARRAAGYKRAELFFTDLARLRAIAKGAGHFQAIFAGKAHPQDQPSKEMIKRIFALKAALGTEVPVVYLADYDISVAKLVTSGVDLWLNTPQPPLEASGTSGMKAALNGVPSLSTLDGWWIEGCIEDVTGWAIDGPWREFEARPPDPVHDAASLYDKLEHVILPLFYRDRDKFLEVMRHAIALNGSFFNTQRMMQQYVLNAYFE